jgi:hypothetical protein
VGSDEGPPHRRGADALKNRTCVLNAQEWAGGCRHSGDALEVLTPDAGIDLTRVRVLSGNAPARPATFSGHSSTPRRSTGIECGGAAAGFRLAVRAIDCPWWKPPNIYGATRVQRFEVQVHGLIRPTNGGMTWTIDSILPL